MNGVRLALVVGLVVVAGGVSTYVLATDLQEPEIERLDLQWGEVTEDTTTIRATVIVDNPNGVGVPAVFGLDYTASMNDVALADGNRSGLGLSPGRNELELAIPVRNDQIPAWWVTHINRGERSMMVVNTSVTGPLGLEAGMPPQRHAVDTDLLEAFGSTERQEISLVGRPVLVVHERDVAWGDATAEATPLTISARVTNVHDRPITFDGLGYTVWMNGITVAADEDREPVTIAPGETTTIDIEAAIEPDTLDDWWVRHLERGERTNLSVETYAIVDGGPADPTVELDLMTLGLEFETDLLGDGPTRTHDVTRTVGGDLAFDRPSVVVDGLAWGDVTDATTDLEATARVENPNADSPLTELLDLTVRQRAAINGVEVANDTTTVEDLPTGNGTLTVTTPLDNTKVPRWWARHVNSGETSTVVVESTATADVGVTAIDLPVATREHQFSTDLLAPMNHDDARSLEVAGRPAITLLSSRATWGEATPQRTPIDTRVTLRNDRDLVATTVSDIAYTITLNDVTIADGTDPTTVTVAPGETETVPITMVIDSPKMADWWVTHLENDETSTMSVELTATITVGGISERVTIDVLPPDATVETDILGQA